MPRISLSSLLSLLSGGGSRHPHSGPGYGYGPSGPGFFVTGDPAALEALLGAFGGSQYPGDSGGPFGVNYGATFDDHPGVGGANGHGGFDFGDLFGNNGHAHADHRDRQRRGRFGRTGRPRVQELCLAVPYASTPPTIDDLNDLLQQVGHYCSTTGGDFIPALRRLAESLPSGGFYGVADFTDSPEFPGLVAEVGRLRALVDEYATGARAYLYGELKNAVTALADLLEQMKKFEPDSDTRATATYTFAVHGRPADTEAILAVGRTQGFAAMVGKWLDIAVREGNTLENCGGSYAIRSPDGRLSYLDELRAVNDPAVNALLESRFPAESDEESELTLDDQPGDRNGDRTARL